MMHDARFIGSVRELSGQTSYINVYQLQKYKQEESSID